VRGCRIDPRLNLQRARAYCGWGSGNGAEIRQGRRHESRARLHARRRFPGRDTFCTRNTSPKVKGEALSECITVTVE